MNEIFNFKRFGKCLGSDLVRGVSKYGVTLLILGFLEVLVYLFLRILMLIFIRKGYIGIDIMGSTCNVNSFPVSMVFSIAVTILIFGMPTALYGHVTDRRAGADFLMVPASSLEKFLSMIVVCVIVFPAVFLGIFLGTDAILGAVDGSYESIRFWFLMNGADVSRWLLLFALCSSVTTFLLGAIWFRRHKIIYTLLILMALGTAAAIAIAVIGMNTDLLDGYFDYDINSFKFNWPGFLWEAVALALCYLRIRKLQH